MQEMWVWSLGCEDPLGEEIATRCSILAWKIPCKEPGRLQPTGSQRVGHDWAAEHTSVTPFESLSRQVPLLPFPPGKEVQESSTSYHRPCRIRNGLHWLSVSTKIQLTADQKYSKKIITESHQKQNLILPCPSNCLHSMCIVLGVVTKSQMI